MSEMNEGRLRTLIRLLPPVTALREDLEKSLHLEAFAGTGDLAMRSFEGLRASVARVAEDPYLDALALTVPEGVTDQQKVSMVLLAVGQLAAYVEGQTGLVSQRGRETGNIHIQKAPNIAISNISGVTSDVVGKMVALGNRVMEEEAGVEEQEAV